MNKLLEAAKAVLKFHDMLEEGVWTSESQFYTLSFQYIERLTALRQSVQEAETYKPMTDDELQNIAFRHEDTCTCQFNRDCLKEVERAVIERLGLAWGGQ